MRRGSRHPEYAWLHWARELPRQFVPAGYRSSLPPDWVHWLAFRLNQTCPGCGTPVCRPRRKGPAATGRGGGPHGFHLDHLDGDASNGHALNFQWLCPIASANPRPRPQSAPISHPHHPNPNPNPNPNARPGASTPNSDPNLHPYPDPQP